MSYKDVLVLQQLHVDVPAITCNSWILTRWNLPSQGRYKLNSDGSCKGNPGPGGGGSMLRRDDGSVDFAQADFYGDTTNNKAEAMALLQGLQQCKKHNIFKVNIELDSMLVVQILQGNTSPPCAIAYEIRNIVGLLQHFDFVINHVFREANRAADFLANLM